MSQNINLRRIDGKKALEDSLAHYNSEAEKMFGDKEAPKIQNGKVIICTTEMAEKQRTATKS